MLGVCATTHICHACPVCSENRADDGDKSDFSHVAAPYLQHDINVAVVIIYRLSPDVSLAAIVQLPPER
ncbi:hypothetical protein Tamer19_61360 [Cupriavidus sp. TA19]|uniref:hypothetical protein n=1 Tax=unclassified Cupriavidus TaxID=2640874 RepID=UPI000ECDAD0F|nr:hypothetical protein [Cupriavidus sp. TA19]BDB28712.1 hypothetical protein CTP10_R61230 [Cupriavidus sp. P-10]GLC96727.1 hypothetical protein Tamer19_61360 [Cupriavidus sp. TA19]